MAKETYNIYIQPSNKAKIDNLKVKYQLSLTTIVDILIFVTLNTFKYLEQEKLNDLKEKYLYKKGKKTSIKKPKIEKMLDMKESEKTRFATNVLEIYLNKDIKKYTNNQDLINKYYNQCNEKMTTTYDEFWNYNQHIRMQRRMLKENKEYFKRELERV